MNYFPPRSLSNHALRTCAWCALVLTALSIAVPKAHAQPPNASTNDSNGTRPLPAVPGESLDLPDRYKNDASFGIALREQERTDSLTRQKQLIEATNLLLQLARELRAQLAANPDSALAQSEAERLKLIEKLAHLIQDRERAQDQVSAALAETRRKP